ncbi:MAG: hypothetical protein PGN13_07070 [Patulibacter minatonensis]
MASIAEHLRAGLGQPADSALLRANRALSARDRRRVHRLVRRGEAAWDHDSARYAVEVATLRLRAPAVFRPRTQQVVFIAMALGAAALAAGDLVGGHPGFDALLYSYCAVLFGALTVLTPRWQRGYARSRAANLRLLEGDRSAARSSLAGPAPGRPSPGEPALLASSPAEPVPFDAAGFSLVAALVGVPFGAAMTLGDDGTGVIGGIVGGLLFGVLFTWMMRAMNLRAQRAGEGPPLPLSASIAAALPPQAQRPLRVVGVGLAVVFVWMLAVASSQVSTCEVDSGGVPTAAQHGFLRGYCESPGASTMSLVAAYALLIVIPLLGLLIAGRAAGWRPAGERWRGVLTGAGVALAPVLIAWLIAGAH